MITSHSLHTLLVNPKTYQISTNITPYLEYLPWSYPLSLAYVLTIAISQEYLRFILVTL
jgi:hypothetical protein